MAGTGALFVRAPKAQVTVFTFFSPWLLLGALAVAAPVWLHLRRKTERNIILFSALRFLDDQPVPQQSPLRLRDILLFLLRVTALLLLVSAFAWPYIRNHLTAVVKESRVYILDNTLSHQANNGFAFAREKIASELLSLGSDIQAAVVVLDSQPRVLAGLASSREEATAALKNLQPSFQRGSYLAAFRMASDLLQNGLGDQKRILFFGDNQENQWGENQNIPPFLKQVEVVCSKAPALEAPNVSLSEPRIQRVFLGEKSLVNFTVKFTHEGPARQATVVLRANRQIVFNRNLALTNQSETLVLQSQWEASPAEWLRGDVAVRATPDALPGDNQVFFSLAPLKEGKVALLAQSSYLRLALSPDVMRGNWATRILEPSKLADELNQNQDADVLCVESSYLQSADARKLVWRYLTNGRGVMLMVNRVTPAVVGALRELGFEAATDPVSGKKEGESFRYVFSNHPIFHPFTAPDFGNLMEVKVRQYARLKPVQGTPLVFNETGDGLFFQGTRFPGKLFVAAFGFEREQTSWPVHLTFIPFLDLCLQNARPEDATPSTFEPGETAVINMPSDANVWEVVLRGDAGVSQRAPVTQGTAHLRMPNSPGLYSVSYDNNSTPEKYLGVNPSPMESRLSYVDSSETLKLWKLDGPKVSKSLQAKTGDMQLSAILQQRIWWWLLLVALGLILVETIWAALRKRLETRPLISTYPLQTK